MLNWTRVFRGVGSAAAIVFALAACDEEEPLEHGFVKLSLLRSQAEAMNPYVSTVVVEARLVYGECLSAFYDANPEYQQRGPKGELVFGPLELGGEGWQDRLCDPQDSNQVACTVSSIEQQFDQGREQLTVRYDVLEDSIEGKILKFGPLPTQSLVSCGDLNQTQPIVVLDVNPVSGFLADGRTVLWRTQSFTPGVAATNQGAAIQIRAERND